MDRVDYTAVYDADVDVEICILGVLSMIYYLLLHLYVEYYLYSLYIQMIALMQMPQYHDDIEISLLTALVITDLASSNTSLLKTSPRLMKSNICAMLSKQMKSSCIKLQSIVKGRQWMHCNFPYICKVCSVYGKKDHFDNR